MTTPSLSVHAGNYSPWGVAFHKSFLYNENQANLVLYLRDPLFGDLLVKAEGDPDQLRYMTPLRPKYQELQENTQDKMCDYTSEREWRTPGPVSFSWDNLAFICVPDMEIFQELLPDLYKKASLACVQIKCIDNMPTPIDRRPCALGYKCVNQLCQYGHTVDQLALFKWRHDNHFY